MAELVSLRAPFPITPLHELEVRTSIRRRMKGSPTDKPAMRSLRKEKGMVALRAFDKAFSDRFFHVVNVDHRIIFSQAEELSAAHACETGSRSLDILHVASARTIPTRVGRTSPRGQSSDRHSDHPHAGGENGVEFLPSSSPSGPSPRGWGEPRRAASRPRRIRTIPTRVGRTNLRRRSKSKSTDHPHAGGENPPDVLHSDPDPGPSPRGWGERSAALGPDHHARTIPTRVGRTFPGIFGSRHAPDHPHAGGENHMTTYVRRCQNGPSPRGWGERQHGRQDTNEGRTIPTRVGRTGQRRKRSPR